MTEPRRGDAPTPAVTQDVDPGARIEALRARGGARFDPVRFRFIEAFARRAEAQRGEVRRVLDARLAAVLNDYGERFERGSRQAAEILACATERFPHAADDLRQRYDAGHFGDLRRLALRLEAQSGGGALAGLLAHIRQHSPGGADDASGNDAGACDDSPGELKALAYFRNTWSTLKLEQQLAQALAQAPENAGPLNSHLLVLQSLKAMRAISPDYLKRFMAYVDALLWLDQADSAGKTAQKSGGRGERDKKRKPARGG